MKNIPQLTFMNNNSELYFQIAFLLPRWKKGKYRAVCAEWRCIIHYTVNMYVWEERERRAGHLCYDSATRRDRDARIESRESEYLALQQGFIRYHRMCCRITWFLSFFFTPEQTSNFPCSLFWLQCVGLKAVCVGFFGGRGRAWWQL